MVMIMAILWIAGFADAKDLYWKDLPRYLKDNPVTVRDGDGVDHAGRFVSTTVDSIVVDNGHRVVIPRRSILFLTRHATRDSHISPLLIFGVGLGLAPRPLVFLTAPVGFVVFVAGLPVCALRDVFDRRPYTDVVIRLLPDPL
jgi:hypothetical protein